MNNDLITNKEDLFIIAEKKFLEVSIGEQVKIFLVNGIKIDCHILEYDDVCVIVTGKAKNTKQLLYKSAIASINSVL